MDTGLVELSLEEKMARFNNYSELVNACITISVKEEDVKKMNSPTILYVVKENYCIWTRAPVPASLRLPLVVGCQFWITDKIGSIHFVSPSHHRLHLTLICKLISLSSYIQTLNIHNITGARATIAVALASTSDLLRGSLFYCEKLLLDLLHGIEETEIQQPSSTDVGTYRISGYLEAFMSI
ncbi:hypothetical protein YC2023_075789 [Brassica napus]